MGFTSEYATDEERLESADAILSLTVPEGYRLVPVWQEFLEAAQAFTEIAHRNSQSGDKFWEACARLERAISALSAGLDVEPSAVECHGLDTPERVCFYEQDFYVLSNFSAFEVRWTEAHSFKTAEHCYHWLRFATGAANGKLGGARPTDEAVAIADAVRRAPSAHEAFKVAQEHKHLQRADWNEVKVEKMRMVIRTKALQHEYVLRKLLATGDRELVENSWRDDLWGWGPNRDGQNMLGKLWMEVRAELRTYPHRRPLPPPPAVVEPTK